MREGRKKGETHFFLSYTVEEETGRKETGQFVVFIPCTMLARGGMGMVTTRYNRKHDKNETEEKWCYLGLVYFTLCVSSTLITFTKRKGDIAWLSQVV